MWIFPAVIVALAVVVPSGGPTAGGTAVVIEHQEFTFTQIASSRDFTVALGSDGKAYAWGENAQGQLGNGSTTNALAPVPVDTQGVLAGKTITAVAAGWESAVALDSTGALYTWGLNSVGNLGDGSFTDSTVPVAVDRTGVLAGKTVTDVIAGAYFTIVVTSSGELFSWGRGTSGELGNGVFSHSAVPVAVDMSGVLAGKVATEISAGAETGYVLTSDGQIFTWGANFYGQLGTDTLPDSAVPVAVDMSGALAGKTVTGVDAGAYHAMARTSDSTLVAWGGNFYGEIGDGTTIERRAPAAVDMTGVLAGKTIVSIAGGGGHSVVVASDGTLYAWGVNGSGELGDGTTAAATRPVAVDMTGALAGRSVTQVVAGLWDTQVLASDGHPFAWGFNGKGNLGDGTGQDSLAAVAVVMPQLSGVLFGATPSTSAERISATHVRAVTPAHVSGTVDVHVLTGGNAGYPAVEAVVPQGFTFGSAPTVTTPPLSTDAAPGATVSVSAVGSGDEAPGARWEYFDPATQTWLAVTQGVTASAAQGLVTTTSLTLVAPRAGQVAYRAVFANPLGTATSDPAIVTVVPTAPRAPTVLTGSTLPATGVGVVASTSGYALGALCLGAVMMIVRRRFTGS